MSHADDHILDATGRTLLEESVQRWNQRFTSLETEPLVPHITGVKKFLEGFRFIELSKDVQLIVKFQRRFIFGNLHLLQKPIAFDRIGDVRNFCADISGVGSP